MAKQSGTTPYMAILSVFTILLSKLSGQEDTIIGTSTAGRRHADLENIIGMFVNTLVLRNSPEGETRFNQYLGEVKENTLQAFENQEYQFEDFVERLSVRRDTGRNPIFDVMFSFLNQAESYKRKPSSGTGDRVGIEGAGGGTASKPVGVITSKFDLTLSAVEGENNLALEFEYCTKLFKEQTVRRFVIYFKGILQTVSKMPHQKIGDIQMITPQEKAQVLYQFNGITADYPQPKTIHQLFEEQVEKTPDRISTVGPWQYASLYVMQITYRELNEKSNRLARLLRSKAVEPGTIVAIKSERSAQMIIGLLGILKAGGHIYPLIPGIPKREFNICWTTVMPK